MSLFAAYGGGDGEARDVPTLKLNPSPQDACVAMASSSSCGSSPAASPRREHRLLHSDSDSDGGGGPVTASTPVARAPLDSHTDYYVDCKCDTGNLRVSTLYYPGRPDYLPCERRRAVGAAAAAARRSERRHRQQRYWRQPPVIDNAKEQAHLLAAAYRAALRDSPRDELLWLQYIHHQTTIGETDGMEAALDAVKHVPHSRALCERSHALMQLALTPQAYVQRLQRMLTEERSAKARGSLWARLIGGVARAADAGAVAAVAAAGVADVAGAGAYPALLHAYGGYLRAAGLWEDLVLLVELVSAMSFPRGFPPPRDPAAEADVDRQLEQYEQTTIASGLPLGEIWSRVERARAAVHWRPALSLRADSDPQRAPLPSSLAPLLTPLTPHHTQHVIVTLLRLAEVPLMPVAEHVARALDPDLSAHGWEVDSASGVLGVLRAARRVRPGHPAHVTPEGARRVLAVTPPRVLADAGGYSAWVSALWDAAGQWTASERGRGALACWRLRWLHARLLHTTDQTARRRLRNEARAVAVPAGAACRAACSVAARVEAAAAGPARGLHTARAALHAAIGDRDAPTVDVLYAARVVMELCEAVGAATYSTALWAACSAVLRRPVPPHADSTPPPDLVREAALRECEERCCALESSPDGPPPLTDVWSAMLPSDSEWFAMRAALAPYSRRRELLAELAGGVGDGAALRRREAAACALVAAAGREHAMASTARGLAALFPHNAYINIVAAGAPLWSRSGPRDAYSAIYTDTGALTAALPAMLGGEWCRLRRVVARCLGAGAGVGGGGALQCWRLLACSALCVESASAALHSALAACPYSHALHVRGAALCPPLALSMPDLMLERRLRTHALPTELTPL